MFSVQILFNFIFLNIINGNLQINLHLTNWLNENDDIQHDCLYISAYIKNENDPRHIISYCMGEWISKLDIKENKIDNKISFEELSKLKIKSEDLYFWSAPIDIIEEYQFYLNQLLNSEKTLLGKNSFYNCTLPNFGSQCQYSLVYYKSNYSSLNKIIFDYYYYNIYEPTLLTCYIHLECNRGPFPSCLDWTEICDGNFDCLNNNIDEEYCWLIEISQCNHNEYQCSNGQCIPKTFFRDDPYIPDCLDKSDEYYRSDDIVTREPTFYWEDITCVKYFERNQLNTNILTSSCLKKRQILLSQVIFSIKPKSIPNECWSALKCIIQMPIIPKYIYVILCPDKLCNNIIEKTCPDIIFIPAVPVLFGHIYLAYEKNKMNYEALRPSKPTYFCYDYQLVYLPDDSNSLILDNNYTCRFYQHSINNLNQGFDVWLQIVIYPLYSWLKRRKLSVYNNSTYCDQSKMYQCINSMKCISKSRLFDGVNDCDYGDDDENLRSSNETCLPEQNLNKFKCETDNKCNSIASLKDPKCGCIKRGEYCDARKPEINFALNRISFQTICDGIIHLLSNNIKYGNDTDETNCEQWQCNNIYTHCDGFWNCLDGADEINCYSSPLLNCSQNNHICVSSQTKQLICLPIEKANDGNIDCIGAVDEPNICRRTMYNRYSKTFHCQNDSYQSCISGEKICDWTSNCKYNDDEQGCINNATTIHPTFAELCKYDYESYGTDVLKTLCRSFYNTTEQWTIYFKLNKNDSLIKSNVKYENSQILTKESPNENVEYYQQRCHRGLDLQVWLDKEKNLTKNVCLCPASYYGDICQYQNQRISLTLQFLVTSDSVQIPFIIIISLIDDKNENLIHSYEQFTYLSMKYCQRKFNFYLLYSTRPKNPNINYLIHIDIYEKLSLNYRGSIIKSFNFTFLPVHRLAFQINIPRTNYISKSCLNHQCVYGKCQTYFNDPYNRTFCQCQKGWYGKYCTYKHNCTCSDDSLCIGLLANNRSLCICPWNKIGSRCLINNTICDENNEENQCLNNGQCIPLDEYGTLNNKYVCICPEGFSGDRCEINGTKIIVSFDKNLDLPPSILVHFIEVKINDFPIRRTTFKTIPIDFRSIHIYWSYPFHIIFIELLNKNYYLTVLQNFYNELTTIEKQLKFSDRCLNISEIFNETILNYPLIRRIKYYHLPCQNKSLNLSCFYDEYHFCLCQIHEQLLVSNCFEFEHYMKMDCFGQNGCENNGQCFQDDTICPKTSLCLCPNCFYGKQCQFNTNGFSLSLDAILGYHIKPNINIFKQSHAVLISLILTLIISFAGIINGLCSLITFKDKNVRQSGSGIYLLCSSIIILLTMILFILKFFILITSQIELIENKLFLNIQCISIDFFLRVCLTIDQWLTSSVAIERAFITIKGISFNQKKTIQTAKYIIIIIISIIILTTIHDPIHRQLFYEDNYHYEDKRIWCIVKYSSTIQYFNLIINIFHFIVPFIINLISAIIIIIVNTRKKANIQAQQNYRQILIQQFQKHKNLLIGPLVLVILSIPRLIISFASGCMKSTSDSWLFLLGYFISLIPPTLTFLLFVLPSTTYKQAFQKAISRYKNII